MHRMWITEPAPGGQHRLEEGAGQQVEHRRRISADGPGVAQLQTGRIGDDALEVLTGGKKAVQAPITEQAYSRQIIQR